MMSVLTSCGDINSSSSDHQGLVSHDGTNLALEFPLPRYLAYFASIDSLQAQAIIDEGNPYPLMVDQNTNQISGTITGVPSGDHDLIINYFISTAGGKVILCKYSTQVTVNAGKSTYVEILDKDLDRNLDDDHDGYTNLAEVRIKTDPLDASDIPAGESPFVICGNGRTQNLSSANFHIEAVVGSTLAGTTSSHNYRVIIPPFPGSEQPQI